MLHKLTRSHRTVLLLLLPLAGCSTAPKLGEYPVTTPKSYSENKAFFLAPLGPQQYLATTQGFKHIYQVDPKAAGYAERIIKHNDPISVVLQGVRVPESEIKTPRDIAVILDINTSGSKELTTLVAFYQRDVRPGQMLNFNNLLVFADPMWDSSTPPYFRIRLLDVKAERNRATAQGLAKVSNLSNQIGGVIPHPIIPLVSTAIDTAGVILSNRENEMLLDFQIQFYGAQQHSMAGGASLGALIAGPWIVVGREQQQDSSFWNTDFVLERNTDRIGVLTDVKDKTGTAVKTDFKNLQVPYVSVALMKADAEVPKLVFDRSEALLNLLSTPASKGDVDSLQSAAASLTSAIDAFTVERRLNKYRSRLDVEGIINKLRAHYTGASRLNDNELRRLIYVLDRATFSKGAIQEPSDWVKWWEKGGHAGVFTNNPESPLGFVYGVITPPPPQDAAAAAETQAHESNNR